MITTLCK